MINTTISKLYSFNRHCFFYTSVPLFVRSRICLLVMQSFLLLIGLAACAPTPTPPVRFAVIGDYGGTKGGDQNQPDPPGATQCVTPSGGGDVIQCESAVATLVLSWNPDFIITTGDNNYPDGGETLIAQNITQYYQTYITNDLSTNRFYPSLGNHDWQDKFPGGDATAYLSYFTLPGNERYYEMVKGPVHLFAIDSDPNEPDGNTSTSAQASWLQTSLAASTAPWKLVFFHHPPYSSGQNKSPWMDWPFQTWGATAVLTGHDHFYERVMNGIPYFVNGLGGWVIFPCADPACSPSAGAAEPGSQVRYNADYGAMLVQASSTCINFQFINRSGVVIDSYTIPPPNAPFDYYVRDWTDSPTSGDTGVTPSTHANFYTTSDVWNRRSNAPGGFNANNQPQNENPTNGSGAAGDNFAFVRVSRNGCAAERLVGTGPWDTVTARFLYSEFGTGSNYQTAGAVSGSAVDFVPDTLNAANTVQTKTMDQGHPWHLPTTSSTHLCLAVEISTPSDPAGPTLLGHAPGWPTTDNMVINDNNKAQRNMGVYPAVMKSMYKWYYYAIAHNAATYKRSMVLRYEAPSELLRSRIQIEVINPQKMTPREDLKRISDSRNTIILEDMQPGENRWIGVAFESVDGAEGQALPVSFSEVVNNKAVNGFTIAPVPSSWPIVSGDILKFHASVFARIAALFEIANAKEEGLKVGQLLQGGQVSEGEYVIHFKKQISSINEIIAELLKSQRAEDVFGILVELKNFSTAIQEGAISPAVPAHSNVLHKLDAFLTMLQKSKGDPSDILQNVLWQTNLFAKLPQQKALRCSKRQSDKAIDYNKRESGDVVVESNDFRKAYEARKIGNDDYSHLISDLLPCFEATAKEFGGAASLQEDIANMVKSLNSPVALQKAHHGYLLKLQNVVK